MQVVFDHATKHGPRVSTFYFKPEHPLQHEAGQFIELTLDHPADARGTKRWFTLSSAPSDTLVSITTRVRSSTSSFKQALHELKPGDTLHMSEAMGDFVLPKDPTIPLVFIAGGIGITPFLSMARQLAHKTEKRRIRLCYVVHAINDALFKEELMNANFDVSILLSKHHTGHLLSKLLLVPESLYYISGPELLAQKLTSELGAQGVKPAQIVTDYFPGY